MYYERIKEVWKPDNKKSVFFNNDTYPIDIVPVEFWNADRMPAAPIPVYDATTHKRVGPQDLGDGTVGYLVEPLPSEDLEAARQSTVLNIVRAVRFYVEEEIDAAGMILIQDLIAVGSQKAIDCKAWGLAVYAEAEYRKALILADMGPDDTDPCDFSSFGPKPYTVAQLMAEV